MWKQTKYLVRVYTLRLWSRLFTAIKKFLTDDCSLISSALSYKTIISLVPLLAVSFSIFKAFGGLEDIETKIHTLIFKHLIAHSSETVTAHIEQFLNNINTKAVGVIGVILLFFIAISLLNSVEQAFNKIWQIRGKRSLISKITTFWSILTLTPFLIGCSIYLSRYIMNLSLIKGVMGIKVISTIVFFLIPLFITIIAFAFCYIFLPRTKVRISCAIYAGILAGCMWEIAKYGFAFYVSKSITYNKIYGALGIIPILLIWIYICWVVVLFGAEFCYVLHFQPEGMQFLKNNIMGELPYGLKEKLGISLIMDISKSFLKGKKPPTIVELSEKYNVPQEVILEVLFLFKENGLLITSEEGNSRFFPAKDLEKITLAAVINCMRDKCKVFSDSSRGDGFFLPKLYVKCIESTKKEFENLTIKEALKTVNV